MIERISTDSSVKAAVFDKKKSNFKKEDVLLVTMEKNKPRPVAPWDDK